MHYLILSLIMLAGLFSIVCAAKNYDWFMSHRKAQTMIAILGRTGTRIFYITLGAALVVVGAVLLIRGDFPKTLADDEPRAAVVGEAGE